MNTLQQPPDDKETYSYFDDYYYDDDYGTPTKTGFKHGLQTWLANRSVVMKRIALAAVLVLAVLVLPILPLLFTADGTVDNQVISLFEEDPFAEDTIAASAKANYTRDPSQAITVPNMSTDSQTSEDSPVYSPPPEGHPCRTTVMRYLDDKQARSCYDELLLLLDGCIDYLKSMPSASYPGPDGHLLRHYGVSCWYKKHDEVCNSSHSDLLSSEEEDAATLLMRYQNQFFDDGITICEYVNAMVANHTIPYVEGELATPVQPDRHPSLVRMTDVIFDEGGVASACKRVDIRDMAKDLAEACLTNVMLEESWCQDYLRDIPSDDRAISSDSDLMICLRKLDKDMCNSSYNDAIARNERWTWLEQLLHHSSVRPSYVGCERVFSSVADDQGDDSNQPHTHTCGDRTYTHAHSMTEIHACAQQ